MLPEVGGAFSFIARFRVKSERVRFRGGVGLFSPLFHRHDIIKCLSEKVRDAVVSESAHKISDQCRKQLRIERFEEVS